MTTIDLIIIFWLLCSSYTIGAHTILIVASNVNLSFVGYVVNILIILAMGPLGVLAAQDWNERIKDLLDEQKNNQR